MEVKLNDLPDLPFEKILSYFSLEDRLKWRSVSRKWCKTIDGFKVTSLCFSSRQFGFVEGKSRWMSGAFALNFVSSTRFGSFSRTFSQLILANLKHLRLCQLNLSAEDAEVLPSTLNSFGQLRVLDLLQVHKPTSNPLTEFELNLPMLTSLQMEDFRYAQRLTLNAPRLQKVKLTHCYDSLILDFVHGESVEWLAVGQLRHIEMKKLKNLKYLYTSIHVLFLNDLKFLSGLKQLREIHMMKCNWVGMLFEAKKQYGLVDLRVYKFGLLQNGIDDPYLYEFYEEETFACLAEKQSELADEMPFYEHLPYGAIQLFAPGQEMQVLKRFVDLTEIRIDQPVQDIERFLDLLKKLDNIEELYFDDDQPQELFDRLPDYCAVQKLIIYTEVQDLAFLFRLKSLLRLDLEQSIDVELIREISEQLPFLSKFSFNHINKKIAIQIHYLKQIEVSIEGRERAFPDLNTAIRHIDLTI